MNYWDYLGGKEFLLDVLSTMSALLRVFCILTVPIIVLDVLFMVVIP